MADTGTESPDIGIEFFDVEMIAELEEYECNVVALDCGFEFQLAQPLMVDCHPFLRAATHATADGGMFHYFAGTRHLEFSPDAGALILRAPLGGGGYRHDVRYELMHRPRPLLFGD